MDRLPMSWYYFGLSGGHGIDPMNQDYLLTSYGLALCYEINHIFCSMSILCFATVILSHIFGFV